MEQDSIGEAHLTRQNNVNLHGVGERPSPIAAMRHVASMRLKKPTPLSKAELNAILAAAEEDALKRDLKDIAVILYHTGLRVRELVSLRWKNVDFKHRRIFIAEDKAGNQRTVPFGSKVFQVLLERKAFQSSSRFVLGRAPNIVLDRITKELRNVSSRLQRPSVRLHIFRSTFISRWMAARGNFAQLCLITGCLSLSMRFKNPDMIEELLEGAATFQRKLEEEEL